MIISENWLREWVSPKLDARGLADKLTLAGIEVSAVTPLGGGLAQVVVGRITAIGPHPNADRLRICQVDVGKGRSRTIVCGAANAAAGLKVPAALPGAVLPNGAAIKEAAVRGVASEGMLCSAQELGLAEASEGLLVLDDKLAVGLPLAEALSLPDHQLEIELTPNRADCLSIAGLAREVAALTGARLKGVKIKDAPVAGRKKFKVTVQAKRECPHYVGRVITGIDPHATTPLWMVERLRRSGIRNIHPVVDVTNYVMLELGQPMHAFDLDRLEGGLVVRPAQAGESLELLDGSKIEPAPGALLIADAARPLALAGIMGGAASGVTGATRNLFLESAYFAPATISKYARHHGLHTDSSHRFERGVDPALQRAALERASALLLDIVGGECGPITEVSAAAHMPKRAPILLRHARINRLLGATLPAAKVAAVLSRLGMQVRVAAGGWRVTPPSYRFDIGIEADLIEEIARVVGYETFPGALPTMQATAAALPETRVPMPRFRHLLVDRDYQEVITYSFVDPALQALIEPDAASARLANPIASNMAVMRTSLWPGLLQAVLYNQNRQQERLRFFELGARYLPRGGAVAEEAVLAGVVSGPAMAEQWGVATRNVDFFDLKGDIDALLALSGAGDQFACAPARHPALHPGQAAEITRAGRRVGFMGALHPQVQAQLGLSGPIFLFELVLAGIEQVQVPIFHELSKFPSIRRDLALVLDERIPAAQVLAVVREAAGELLVNVGIFDEYRGEGIDSGRKSLGLALTLQDFSRTLKEEVVEAVMARVISALQARMGAQLRQ